ncbi:BURP domain-containing protein 13-like [Phragmites australis]|uniref:BURP domain-containing protein 13-like n=1 Tax=Phragmites australis TaxID=29695 RepID=UPI002D76EB79|nr:BURP domain-containing protein 13-like [Phragmites australis]
MARFVAVLLTAAALLAVGRLSHAAPSTAEMFWRAVLPSSAVPDTVLRLLRPDTSFVSKGKVEGGARPRAAPFNYQNYKRSSPARDATLRDDTPFSYDYKEPRERRATLRDDTPFSYDYKEPSERRATPRGAGATMTTVFFHEGAVRVGERLPFHFPAAVPAALGFLPRHVADSIPFSAQALPGVLALFGVSPDTVQAAGMKETLRTCESPPLAGEAKFCATSLEALVERAMAALGSRDVSAVTSTLPRAGAPLQLYTVHAVRPVDGESFVACHDEAYPYTVYRCHGTGPARAYMLDMEGARSGAVTVATVCHTDTSRWNPEHVSFKLLGTKPGGEPICHLMPYGHIIWAKNVKRSPA